MNEITNNAVGEFMSAVAAPDPGDDTTRRAQRISDAAFALFQAAMGEEDVTPELAALLTPKNALLAAQWDCPFLEALQDHIAHARGATEGHPALDAMRYAGTLSPAEALEMMGRLRPVLTFIGKVGAKGDEALKSELEGWLDNLEEEFEDIEITARQALEV